MYIVQVSTYKRQQLCFGVLLVYRCTNVPSKESCVANCTSEWKTKSGRSLLPAAVSANSVISRI